MKRLKVVGVFVVVVGLLAVAGPASAHIATSSILPIKDVGQASSFTFIELVSPVADLGKDGADSDALAGTSLHLVFFNSACTRGESLTKPLSEDDVLFVAVTTAVSGVSGDGLVAIGASTNNVDLIAADQPFEARSHSFDLRTGLIARSYRHIRSNDPESSTPPTAFPQAWPELRTGAFGAFARVVDGISTTVDFICPTTAVYGAWTSGQIPTAPSSITSIPAVVRDHDEGFLRDITVTCSCFTQKALGDLSAVFKDADTYVEFFGASGSGFKAYRTISIDGFSLIHNQLNGVNRTTLDGSLTTDTR